MGHIRLPSLPRTRLWREVVAAIADGSSVEVVAARSSRAAESAFAKARQDPIFLEAVSLLARLPLAARTAGYVETLRSLGLDVAEAPNLFAFTSALSDRFSGPVSTAARPGQPGTSDLGLIAARALIGTLHASLESQMPSLFEADASDLQRALGRFANGQAFGRLARTFFTRFVHGLLDHYLSRELAGHQGLDQRFGNDRQRAEFEAALQQHCWEASLIVEAYAGGWLGKHVYKEGLLTERHIADFAAYSLTKIRQELRSRADG